MVSIFPSPLVEELDTGLSTVTLFELFRKEPFCFFLDSGMDPQKLGRYSFMGGSPFLILKSRGENISIIRDGVESLEQGNPLDTLGRCLETYRLDSHTLPFPFAGGAAGYISYDICHFFEKLPKRADDDLQLPDCYFGFYDLVLVFDNVLGKASIVSTGFPELNEKGRLSRARERLEEFKGRLVSLPRDREEPAPKPASPGAKINLRSNFTHEAYIKAVERARQYIIDGDIFEVNLSQRFEAAIPVTPWELYLRLRQINPAPFAAYLDFDEVTIVSASPERFIRCQGDWVETRPIKGTAPRGRTPRDDRTKARELLNSIKDHAENMMIVDLERNDLGRVCRFGSVKVTELAILEKYPTVYHLTSTVVGRLNEGKGRIALLKATLPGGSITGAPKVRSMEIIDELEPTRRSIYTGNIGYLGFDGNMDLSVVIRTFLIKEKRVYFQAGGAVVYDSQPEAEYQETLDKIQALIDALNM
ncbi:MAG: aminodeoxychorismate synthase component I [Dehalococcoidales bacterium]|nr:aminodeoxychorismate synthase component I [Dehalococcoidales bacterium]